MIRWIIATPFLMIGMGITYIGTGIMFIGEWISMD